MDPHPPALSASRTHAANPTSISLALASLAALAIAMGVGRFAFTPILPVMLNDASLALAQGGWLASANYAGYLVGALVAIVFRTRPEQMIRAGLLATGLATLAMGLIHAFPAWMLLRFLAGVASAWVMIAVSAWSMVRLAVFQRPFLQNLVFSGVGIGIALAGLACIGLMRLDAGSTSMWIGLGAVSLAVTGLAWRVFSSTSPAKAAAPANAPSKPFHWNANTIRLVACYGIFGFGYIIPATFLPVMAKEALHGSAAFAWSWPVFGLAAAISTLAVAPLRKHFSNRRLWAASNLVMAAGIVLPVAWPHALSVFAAALCVGGTFMVITLVALLEARQAAQEHAGVVIASMTAAFATGQIIGPLTVGAGGAGFSGGLLAAAAMLAGSTLLLKRRPAHA
ncbi:YbfB/YjiJ family MFS transporter [Massilia cavernae]|uniref:YbfB/YjiJ family MFS transporter n=1 Tax=Massilia cavernae TaxID=2320864 RepID=A0A418XAN6_9BURK|nr:YbfB/YjiJ family MFS transporter [Massilia cavernae]RJG09534.1 YbfB/YjiJ family MFS transporter [Massilia cavernae]